MIKYFKYWWDNWGGLAVYLFIMIIVATGLTIVLFNVCGIHNGDKIIIISAVRLYVFLLIITGLQE